MTSPALSAISFFFPRQNSAKPSFRIKKNNFLNFAEIHLLIKEKDHFSFKEDRITFEDFGRIHFSAKIDQKYSIIFR